MAKVPDDVRDRIDRQNRLFEVNFAAHNAQALVNGYFTADSEQPTASPPGGAPLVKGRAALIEMFTGQFTAMRSIRLETVRLEASGDLAYELGRAHLTLATGDAVMGRYTALWRQIGSEWRVSVDFFAADGWSG